jgi:hypothetical protein
VRQDRGVPASGQVPDVVTHYHLPGRRQFLNLSDLEGPELSGVLAELEGLRRRGQQHRSFGWRYVGLRRQTETRLRELFIARGGKPRRMSPHYFVLGASAWFEGLAPRMQRVELAVAELPDSQTSVTYPDSFVAMEAGRELGITRSRRPYHGKVFLLSELPDLIETYGIPSPSWDGDRAWRNWPEETLIEVQLWVDEPIHQYLSR